jgi:hypothetical protein
VEIQLNNLQWSKDQLGIKRARVELENKWTLSIIDWKQSRWPIGKAVEIAAINPQGAIAYNFGWLETDNGRRYNSVDVFRVPTKHVQLIADWINSLTDGKNFCAMCGCPISQVDFADENGSFCTAYCLEKYEVGHED